MKKINIMIEVPEDVEITNLDIKNDIAKIYLSDLLSQDKIEILPMLEETGENISEVIKEEYSKISHNHPASFTNFMEGFRACLNYNHSRVRFRYKDNLDYGNNIYFWK